MSNRRIAQVPQRKTGRRFAALVATLVAGFAVAWGVHAYTGLLALHVDVVDSFSRVEAVGRSRVELATNLVRTSDAYDCIGPTRLADLRGAIRRAEDLRLSTATLDDPGAFRQFHDAHEQLSAALDATWRVVSRSADPGARVVVEDLEARSRRSAALLEESMSHLDRSLEAYESATERFPGSIVATIASFEGRSKPVSSRQVQRAASGTTPRGGDRE